MARNVFVALGGAGLAAERSEEERSGAKPRGRGLGQLATYCFFKKKY